MQISKYNIKKAVLTLAIIIVTVSNVFAVNFNVENISLSGDTLEFDLSIELNGEKEVLLTNVGNYVRYKVDEKKIYVYLRYIQPPVTVNYEFVPITDYKFFDKDEVIHLKVPILLSTNFPYSSSGQSKIELAEKDIQNVIFEIGYIENPSHRYFEDRFTNYSDSLHDREGYVFKNQKVLIKYSSVDFYSRYGTTRKFSVDQRVPD